MTNLPPPQLPPSNEIIPKPVDTHPLDNYPDNDYPIEVNAPTEYSPTKPQNPQQPRYNTAKSGNIKMKRQLDPKLANTKTKSPQEMGQGSTYLGNQAQSISRGNLNHYGNGDIYINQQNNEALLAAIGALKEITIEAQKQKDINNFPENIQKERKVTDPEGKGMNNNPTEITPVIQEKKVTVLEGKGMNCGLALVILVLNLLWPGVGTIICACYFNNGYLKKHYLVAGIAQIFMAFILIGWCYAFMTSFFLLGMACYDTDAYVYQMNNHSGNCAY